MERAKNIVEEVFLISFFVGLFLISSYFAIYGKDLSAKVFAISLTIFSAKSAGLIFCRSVGLINGHKIWVLSYTATSVCLAVFAFAVLLRCFS